MKWMLIFCMVFVHDFSLADHDVNMATFNLSASDSYILLNISFDKNDYAEVNKISVEQITKSHVYQYLHATTRWLINQEDIDFQVYDVLTKDEHYKVVCKAEHAFGKIETVQIKNEFLFQIADQSNVILLDLNESSRGFRTHETRAEINAQYE